ncbi:hypothetical protein G3580_11035 [Nitrogeniibacter mangrovi]|uniref:DUF2726 domain-containing protein n=1 Tax=Nitrogeniibacter mangrovi TaxID=2016596 RepID=A0A6C1B408_9RHOO|nr:hypothetical protein [Nitrogeniibacter mangrovi]QID18123.1 hypothetical protein G3580_11035 [Nitrogeniibacter mangrovi]
MSWLLLLVVVVVFALLVVVLRKRRDAQREAEEARAQAFLMQVQGAAAAIGAGTEAIVSGAMAAATETPDDTEVAMPASGPTYLDRHHQIVWRWLRAGLPGCEVFARGSLRRIVGRERLQKDLLLDFVICNEGFEVLAVVDLAREGRTEAERNHKSQLLAQRGVRYVCWSAERLPDQTTLSAWIGGSRD